MIYFSLTVPLIVIHFPIFSTLTGMFLNHDWQLPLSHAAASALPHNGVEELALHLFSVSSSPRRLPLQGNCHAGFQRGERICHSHTRGTRDREISVLLYGMNKKQQGGENQWEGFCGLAFLTGLCLLVILALVPMRDSVVQMGLNEAQLHIQCGRGCSRPSG